MTLDRRSFLASAASLLAPPERPLAIKVVDQHSHRPLTARVRFTDAQGREVVPLGHPSSLADDAHEGDVFFQSRRFAYVDGAFTLDPTAGPLRYQVIKGYEYLFAEGELTAANLRQGALTIPLTRWNDLTAHGWYSGDVHIHHIAPKTCSLEMDAEDLHVANILTSDFTADQSQFEGKLNSFSAGKRLIYVNQEFRNDQLGHLNLLNLKKLIDPVMPMQHTHHPLHLGVCDRTHAQGGYVSWAHFPSWPGVEGPLDVAMEKLDGLEILCAIDPHEMPVFMKQVVPELAGNDGLRLWYRFLNCGFRLTATAGTDKMTTFVTVGANRVFARVHGPFTYQAWIDALRHGRTFITNSPVLRFTVNGQDPGAIIALTRARNVLQIHAAADSQLPYHRLEIIANGRVIAQSSPSGPRHHAEIHLEHPVTESCWVAARAVEDLDEHRRQGIVFSKVHSPAGPALSNYFGTRRPETVFAHSSPVYSILDSRPIRSFDDAEYYVRYMDNSIRWLETSARFNRPEDKAASIASFRQGKAIYEQRAREARGR